MIDLAFALGLLRAHVRGRTEPEAALRGVGGLPLGSGPKLRDAEVEDLRDHVTVLVDGDEDVRRLEIAMHDAFGVRDGDPDAVAALVQRRGAAVLAYCDEVAAPGEAVDAAAEAFGSFRASVADADDVRSVDPEGQLGNIQPELNDEVDSPQLVDRDLLPQIPPLLALVAGEL